MNGQTNPKVSRHAGGMTVGTGLSILAVYAINAYVGDPTKPLGVEMVAAITSLMTAAVTWVGQREWGA